MKDATFEHAQLSRYVAEMLQDAYAAVEYEPLPAELAALVEAMNQLEAETPDPGAVGRPAGRR